MKRSFKKEPKGKKSTKRSRRRLTPEHKVLLRQFGLGVVIVSIVAALVTGVWYGSRIQSFTIDSVSVVGGTTVSPEQIETIATRVLADSYLKVVPHRFSPLTPISLIESQIRTIPRVKEVAVTKTDRRSLTILFDEYIPSALWCSEEADHSCLFLDHTGYAFTAAPQLSGNALVRFIVPNEVPNVGQNVLSDEAWEVAQQFISELEQSLSLYVTEVSIDDDVDRTYRLARGGTLKVSNRLSIEDTITNLVTILDSPEFTHLDKGDFHYIDLRFGDKIFVAEEEWQDVATTTDEVVASTTSLVETTEFETD